MNKSASYSALSIVVTRKTSATVTYTLAHGMRGREWTWGAMTGSDRMIVDQLEVGESYFIRTSTDGAGVQHWVEAKKIATGPFVDNAITRKVASAKSKPQIRKDFLDNLIEW